MKKICRILIGMILATSFALAFQTIPLQEAKEKAAAKLKQAQSKEQQIKQEPSLPEEKIIQDEQHKPQTEPKKEIDYQELLNESIRHFERSLNVANFTVILVGILVAVMTLIIIIIGALGYFEINRWKSIKKKIEEEAANAKVAIESIKKDAEFIKNIKESVEKQKEDIQKVVRSTLEEKPSNETKKQFDEINKKLQLLELFGIPLNPEDYLNRGADYFYKGDYEKALELTNKGIELKPNDPSAFFNKAVVLTKMERYEEALKATEKVIELKPNFVDAWDNKGALLDKLGRYAEALEAIERAIELKPDNASAHFNRACSYSMMNNKDEALKSLAKAIKLDSNFKKKAKTDEDFKSLWDDEDFKTIVG